jgi:HNH endonuclease
MLCLFCQSDKPLTVEHVIPESLGNDDLVLVDQVCGACNNHFSKLEDLVLQKTPLAFWRAQLGIKTKRGRLPSVDLSQPKREKGVFPSKHPVHDDNIGFTSHEDGSTSIEIDAPRVINEILDDERTEFRFAMAPRVLFVFGRFLCKVGVELVCIDDQHAARSDQFARARRFARCGDLDSLWPIFHFTKGQPGDFRRVRVDKHGPIEEVDCYAYSLFECSNRYTLAHLRVGTDNWVVCLNEPFPTTEIRSAFPEQELQCIWYSPEEPG